MAYVHHDADKICPDCGGDLVEMMGQDEVTEEIDVLRREFVLVKNQCKKYRCSCGNCIQRAKGSKKLKPGRVSEKRNARKFVTCFRHSMAC